MPEVDMSSLRRKLTSITVSLVLLTALAHSQPSSGVPSDRSISSIAELKTYAPADADDFSVVLWSGIHSQSKLFIAVWSTRSKTGPGSASSTVATIRRVGRKGRVLRRFTVTDAYSPTILVNPDFKYRGSSIALVQMQFGASAARIEAIGLDGSTVRRLASLDADYFNFLTLKGLSYLLAHEDVNLFDVPRLYRWTGSSFIDDSKRHHEFYKSLVAEIKSREDVAKFAPAVQLRFAQLLRLSGEAGASDR